jgi:agmatinase
LNVVGADIVEVAPAYEWVVFLLEEGSANMNSGVGEQTALAGAQIVYEILTSIVKRGLVDMGKESEVSYSIFSCLLPRGSSMAWELLK